MANPILSFTDLVDGVLSEEFDEDESEEEEDESKEEDEEEEGIVDVDFAVYLADQTGAAGSAPEMAAVRNGDEEVGNKCRRRGGSETVSGDEVGRTKCSQGSSSQWNQNEMDGLFCSICLEP
ncbi:hypothetical protein ACFX1Z_012833 [Malus domestica]